VPETGALRAARSRVAPVVRCPSVFYTFLSTATLGLVHFVPAEQAFGDPLDVHIELLTAQKKAEQRSSGKLFYC
jgi:hypothetical protein